METSSDLVRRSTLHEAQRGRCMSRDLAELGIRQQIWQSQRRLGYTPGPKCIFRKPKTEHTVLRAWFAGKYYPTWKTIHTSAFRGWKNCPKTPRKMLEKLSEMATNKL
ncbi:hypothetical protein BABINDRAFT_132164 [Babjeviella inositovora NRRL Y-12698]|uniref:Uncharacterized protein n=1 Tax=Babjeviella inositovora NRRL Y-12698 TaxID=984486 RepID=A0A1E3QRL0_9ASCO|nr:uncharacterized protein BABINDRAFT_132164 [Babjeviella inositovora NRRL Y-12698]ODQ80346.1 hypothetical protein BABINDRAFT_132164 [Babjeviella inositovora NRRL Y-12698]